MKNILDKVTEILMCIILTSMLLAASWQVFTRFILNSPSTLTEEFLRYSLIWLTMIGGAYAFGQKKHVAMNFLLRRLSDKIQNIMRIIVDIIVVIFSFFILFYGGRITYNNAIGQVSAALGVPMQFLYLSLILSGILMFFYAVSNIIYHIKNISIKNY